jgi:predicted nucleotidyltransferase
MIYSLEQIKNLVEPIAKKFNLKALWVFGSYARGDATEESDVDFLMDYTDSKILNLFDINHLDRNLKETFNKEVDLISIDALYSFNTLWDDHEFIKVVSKERLLIYKKP